jgi:hypothetical protein
MSRRSTLLQDYDELRESGSTSDFPNILGNVMYRKMLDWAQRVPSVWRQYAAIGDLADFRPATTVIGYEAEDLLPIGEEGAYQDSALADAAFQIQLGTYGRAFSINRNVIINDDMGYIRQQPKRFGRSAARSIAKFVAQTLLEGNGLCFDGVALFDAATHGNLTTGTGTGDFGMDAIKLGITHMRNQTVLGVYQTVEPRMMLIPPGHEFAARAILNSAIIIAAGGDSTANAVPVIMGNQNVLNGALALVVEPFLTDVDNWYILADADDTPAVAIAFLNGKQTPDLLVEKPVMYNVAGGDDPYEFEFDVMRYKVRYDYGGATALWWGAHKFIPGA